MPASCASSRWGRTHDLYASRSNGTEAGRLYDYQNRNTIESLSEETMDLNENDPTFET